MIHKPDNKTDIVEGERVHALWAGLYRFLLIVTVCAIGGGIYYSLDKITKFITPAAEQVKVPQEENKASLSMPKVPVTEELIVPLERPAPASQLEADLNMRIAAYRHYLREANNLILRFLQDQPFARELTVVSRHDLPAEINSMIRSLEEYNTQYLVNNPPINQSIIPENLHFLLRFIQIEKRPVASKQKEEARARIISNLAILTEYFYSEELQQKFIGKHKHDD